MRLFIATLLLSSCAMAQTPSYDLQGHRGCRGLMPENTIPAFQKALDLGVTTIELDVVVSQDKQVVVSHEPYFNADFSIDPGGRPVAKKDQKSLNLYQMPYAEIKRYDVGSNGNPNYPEQVRLKTYKPLLADALSATEAYRKANNLPPVTYNIEIKSEPSAYGKSQPEPAEFCDLVAAVVRQQLPAERVILQSFDFAVLKHWKAGADAGRYPAVRLSALVANLRSVDKHLEELGFKPAIYSPYFQLVTADKVTKLHELGIQVVPWTVNDADQMRRLLAMGVDGIITDYPNRAKGL